MRLCWVTINVRDLDASLRFYGEVIGLRLDRRLAPAPGMDIVFLRDGETVIELIRNEKNAAPQQGKDISLGFEVASLDATIAELRTKEGLAITGPFQPNPMIRFLYIEDPDGVKIQFVENVKAS